MEALGNAVVFVKRHVVAGSTLVAAKQTDLNEETIRKIVLKRTSKFPSTDCIF